MADSTITDLNKMKVVELRKELKTRGLATTGDKSELVARLQAAMSQDDHGDINLDSDEIDSDGVLEDEDDKSQTDILDDAAVDTLNEELALSEPKPAEETKTTHKPAFKRKITTKTDEKSGDKETATKKIVLNRAISITSSKPAEDDKEQEKTESKPETTDSNKVKITADVDPKTKLELRAKRFGLPVKMSDNERKEARMKRFGQNNTSKSAITTLPSGTLSENLDKLKQRAERFGQSVSTVMTDIENKEKLEKRKAKFGIV